MSIWKTLTSKVVFETPWIKVRHDEVLSPKGSPAQYGVVEFKNRAVGVVPVLDDGRIVMVRQTRYAIGNLSSLEIPEGGAPEGEDWLQTAARELQEETGYTSDDIQPLLTNFYLSNSVTNECGALFIARNLKAGQQELEDTEDIQVELHTFDDLLAMINQGVISDNLTIMALLFIAANRNQYGL
ncbi:NUDIX domain-containing protein [Tolumonas osonensis]|uniref:GDP-mannose pyrophosphatase n=1 Tax=Tolumonas osonensis TaxID=675874 RepID=A0A841GMW8_9GAMM|nr:NUDIX hydrolase [Tolumonas osonensis]MBB6054833.1 ADP-ribose pyrophosphatase [Tolumonas osonensis]